MKRIFLAVVALALCAGVASAQTGLKEVVIPFRATGLAAGPNAMQGLTGAFYADSGYTSRGGAAWGTNVLSQTDTTVWFAPVPDDGQVFRSAAAAGDSVLAFYLAFTPSTSNGAQGLTAAADSIYITMQGTNDGGQNISSTSWNQVVNPTSSNGFTRAMNTAVLSASNPSVITNQNFIGFKAIRFIISSDINGQYVLSQRYFKR